MCMCDQGICCYQSDGANGHANHIFANNTCIYSGEGCRLAHAAHDSTSGAGARIQHAAHDSTSGERAGARIQPYRHTVHCVPNSTQPGSPAFRAWMRNSSFASSGPPLAPLPLLSLLCLRMRVASLFEIGLRFRTGLWFSPGNRYHPAGGDGKFHLRETAPGCVPFDLSLSQLQAMTGEEAGSSQGAVPSVEEVVSRARRLLRME